jgi:hypothetical protein
MKHLLARGAILLLGACAWHANEAATQGGKVLPNTKTAAFQNAAKMPVYAPLSTAGC